MTSEATPGTPMDDPYAPLHGDREQGSRVCQYTPSGHPDDDCAAPATWHIRWDTGDPEADSSLSCDRHMAEVRRRWMYHSRHQIGSDCLMPGAIWWPESCAIPGEDSELVAVAALDISGVASD